MTRLKTVILIGAIISASLAAVLVLWARAAGHVAPGDTGPIFGVISMAMVAVALWASHRRPTSAKVN